MPQGRCCAYVARALNTKRGQFARCEVRGTEKEARACGSRGHDDAGSSDTDTYPLSSASRSTHACARGRPTSSSRRKHCNAWHPTRCTQNECTSEGGLAGTASVPELKGQRGGREHHRGGSPSGHRQAPGSSLTTTTRTHPCHVDMSMPLGKHTTLKREK